MAAEGLLRFAPALLPVLIAFRCLEPSGHKGLQVIVMGCLAASGHCYDQDNLAIDTSHHHSPVKALFAGFRYSYATPDNCSDSVGWVHYGQFKVFATFARCLETFRGKLFARVFARCLKKFAPK